MLSQTVFRQLGIRSRAALPGLSRSVAGVRFASGHSEVSSDPRDSKFTSKNPKDWPANGLVGPYPNVPYEYYVHRPQDVKWDDQQGRRNLGEPLHHQFDLIDVWSPDHFDRLPNSKAYKYNGIFLGIIGAFSFWCWYTWEEPQFVRREYPFDGLNKALGGTEETKELFAARNENKRSILTEEAVKAQVPIGTPPPEHRHMVINQPGTNVKFTNVSHIRMRRGDKRFEIVCYRNKVQDWRSGIEKDIDEVVQAPQVFVNVGKGEVASSSDLQKYFDTTDVDKVVLEILNKGELQVGGKERQQQQERLHQSVLEIVAAKVMNPEKKRPYPATILEKALSRLDFRFSTTKPAKGQALEAIRLLVEKQLIPIARARMKIRVSDDSQAEYIAHLREKVDEIEDETVEDGCWELVALINPSDFRMIDKLVESQSSGGGIVEVLSVTDELKGSTDAIASEV